MNPSIYGTSNETINKSSKNQQIECASAKLLIKGKIKPNYVWHHEWFTKFCNKHFFLVVRKSKSQLFTSLKWIETERRQLIENENWNWKLKIRRWKNWQIPCTIFVRICKMLNRMMILSVVKWTAVSVIPSCSRAEILWSKQSENEMNLMNEWTSERTNEWMERRKKTAAQAHTHTHSYTQSICLVWQPQNTLLFYSTLQQ